MGVSFFVVFGIPNFGFVVGQCFLSRVTAALWCTDIIVGFCWTVIPTYFQSHLCHIRSVLSIVVIDKYVHCSLDISHDYGLS